MNRTFKTMARERFNFVHLAGVVATYAAAEAFGANFWTIGLGVLSYVAAEHVRRHYGSKITFHPKRHGLTWEDLHAKDAQAVQAWASGMEPKKKVPQNR